MKKVFLVKPFSFGDYIAFESEGSAHEYVEMLQKKDDDYQILPTLLVPDEKKGYDGLVKRDA